MFKSPTIQYLSPAYVVSALFPQSYGTYIVRQKTCNDTFICLSHIENQTRTSVESKNNDFYVVLSVRVDETIHRRSIIHYFLSLVETNNEKHTNLLQQYYLTQSHLPNFTPLTNELILPPERNLSWILNPNEFHGINFIRNLSSGKNNDGISDALWKKSNQNDIKIFIKCFSKTSPYFENELNLLKQICFFSIVTLFGYYSDHVHNYLVFSHSGRSLQSICPLRARTERSRIYRIANIGFQITNAMVYLEKLNIVHRDLTASNVLVDSNGYVRIADFGHAIQKEEGKNNLSRSITNSGGYRFQVRFLAPECIPKRVHNSTNRLSDQVRREIYASFSSKSDVWAFGILIIQLMLKEPSKPYPHIEKDRDVSKRIVIHREIHPKPDGCNIDIYYILQQCWAYEPIDRISFVEIREKMKILSSIFR